MKVIFYDFTPHLREARDGIRGLTLQIMAQIRNQYGVGLRRRRDCKDDSQSGGKLSPPRLR
jgi:hypothetical protein